MDPTRTDPAPLDPHIRIIFEAVWRGDGLDSAATEVPADGGSVIHCLERLAQAGITPRSPSVRGLIDAGRAMLRIGYHGLASRAIDALTMIVLTDPRDVPMTVERYRATEILRRTATSILQADPDRPRSGRRPAPSRGPDLTRPPQTHEQHDRRGMMEPDGELRFTPSGNGKPSPRAHAPRISPPLTTCTPSETHTPPMLAVSRAPDRQPLPDNPTEEPALRNALPQDPQRSAVIDQPPRLPRAERHRLERERRRAEKKSRKNSHGSPTRPGADASGHAPGASDERTTETARAPVERDPRPP